MTCCTLRRYADERSLDRSPSTLVSEQWLHAPGAVLHRTRKNGARRVCSDHPIRQRTCPGQGIRTGGAQFRDEDPVKLAFRWPAVPSGRWRLHPAVKSVEGTMVGILAACLPHRSGQLPFLGLSSSTPETGSQSAFGRYRTPYRPACEKLR